jgi:hypothetical protein
MTNDVRQRGGDEVRGSGKAIPIVYQGRQFPNRAALARPLAPLVGKTRSTLITLLSRYDGDVKRAVARFPQCRPITFAGGERDSPPAPSDAGRPAPRLPRPTQSGLPGASAIGGTCTASILLMHSGD